MKEVKRIAKLGEIVKVIRDGWFDKDTIAECIEEDDEGWRRFRGVSSNQTERYWLREKSYVVLEEEFKVGDRVKTNRGLGEIVYIDPRQNPLKYLVGIKGLRGGHSGEYFGCNKLAKEKGYENQCLWFREENLGLVTESKNVTEMVDHPAHYNTGKREVIEEMRLMFGDEAVAAFCKLNAYKYIRRADYKGHKEEDLKKAEWYMDYLEKMGGEVNG